MKYKRRSMAKTIADSYNKLYFGESKVMNGDAFAEEQGLLPILYRDLPNTEVKGYPLTNGRNETGELFYYFQDMAHEICAGTTRIGKTTGLLEPRLRALAYKKNKPCLFISDPKGELFQRNAEFLAKQGYKLHLLNFKDAAHSNAWNPMGEIYDKWIPLKNLGERVVHHKSLEDLMDYDLQDPEGAYEIERGFWSVDHQAYADRADAYQKLESIKTDIEAEVSGLINQLVSTVTGKAVTMAKDPIWEQGGQEIFRGLIYLMLEDALDERSGFTRENMSFMTLQEYYSTIRTEVCVQPSATNAAGLLKPLKKTVKLGHKSYSDESLKHLRPFFENAPTTARSYMGVFDNMLQDWFTPKIYAIATAHDIDLQQYAQQPFVIFLVTRDYEKSDYTIAGLFVDWVYQQMVTMADENGGALDREMFFLLDEFGNIPRINGFPEKISTSLGRRIAFQMYVQSYAQLEAVYGPNEAQIIRDNCNAQSFLGSQNYMTKSTFSKECGTRRIPSLYSAMTPGTVQTQEAPVISVKDLENLQMGEMYLKRLGWPVIKTRFIRAYMCPEFQEDNNTTPRKMGFRSKSYNDEKYVYQYLRNDLSMTEYGIRLDDVDLMLDVFKK